MLAALPVLAVLLGLGGWQMRRLAWKEGLLARLVLAEAAPPAPLLAPAPEPWTRVAVSGRFDHGREALLGAEVRNGALGATLVTPLLRPGQPPLLVLRGWVPLARNQVVDRPEGEQALVGYVRPGETPGWMAARDDPPRRLFYTFTPSAIAEALHLPAPAPFGLVVLGVGGARLPIPATALPRPENPHLGYALTWFGLALTLVGVALAFAWKRWKEGR